MNAIDSMSAAFQPVLGRFLASPAIRTLAAHKLALDHYKAMLREVFHYAKEDPQIQALAAVFFRGRDRESVKMFFKHATSEIGHDLMALEDLKSLGEDVTLISISNPLPTTIALTAFSFYQIQYMNPIGYLGYLYFLEFMPTQAGGGLKEALLKSGVPQHAMSFLDEHMTVDVAHNKLMEEYLRRLVRSDSDLASAIYAMQVTGRLYADMILGAIESVDAPVNFGMNAAEQARA